MSPLILSNGMVEILVAALIAVIIAAAIIFIFNYMSKRAANKMASKAEKPYTVKPVRPEMKGTATVKKPAKKSDDLSQDYLYGLVMGKGEDKGQQAESPIGLKKKG
ncbi:MAG: hypothetical protein QMC99_03150 [Methanocella conradii]|nr:hypothetical protein [Methanocella conradii]